MNPTRPSLRAARSWNPDSHRDDNGSPELLRRRELWLVALMVLFVLLVLIWQQNRTWKLTSELDTLIDQRSSLESRVRLLGTQVVEKRQPDFIMAGLTDEEKPSQDLAGRIIVPADPLVVAAGSEARHEDWLASLGIAVPSAFASSHR